MSIGNIASGIRPAFSQPQTPTCQKPNDALPASPPAATTAGSGTADPFQTLSADIQARLLQLQAMGPDVTPGSTASASAATGAARAHPHHPHPQDNDTDAGASGGLVPPQAATGTLASASPPDTVRQAIQAYTASASNPPTALLR